jgi:DNA-binding GntR family transcriptional regulator
MMIAEPAPLHSAANRPAQADRSSSMTKLPAKKPRSAGLSLDKVPAARSKHAGNGAFEVPKLQRNTLNDEVYQQLKQAIMAGRLEPGVRMTIRSLAAAFGISLMPVREALRRLVAEQVLEMLPNRSVALPVITRERFREITQIRISLESLAAEEAASRITDADIETLGRINDAMDRPNATQSPGYLENNREFHFFLYRKSGLPILVSLIESLWLQIGPLLTIQQAAIAKAPTPPQIQHHALIKALRKRDAKAAGRAIGTDIDDAAKIIAQAL